MKNLLFCLFASIITVTSLAQKTIHLKDNDSIINVSRFAYEKGIVKYIPISGSKTFSLLSGDNVYYIKKNENIYGIAPLSLVKVKPTLLQNDKLLHGALDACRYYKTKNILNGIFWTTFSTGIILSLIPSIPISKTFPKETEFKTADYSLLKDSLYKQGYKIQAKKMKQSEVWTGYGIGALTLFLFVIIASAQY
jgi:hypothetical protein